MFAPSATIASMDDVICAGLALLGVVEFARQAWMLVSMVIVVSMVDVPLLPFPGVEIAVWEILALMGSFASMENVTWDNGTQTGSTALWTAPPALVLAVVVMPNRGIRSTPRQNRAAANQR